MEWLYVNRLSLAILTCFVSIIVFSQLHRIAIDYQYTNPTTDYDIIGNLSDKDQKKAEELTKQDNYFLNKFRGNRDVTVQQIENAMRYSSYYEEATDEEITTGAERVYQKLQVINSEYLRMV